MKTTKNLKVFATVCLFCALRQIPLAQGTAFTYQGRLSDGGAPANGSYDLVFAIYDAANAGAREGSFITNSATAVSNGLFTVTLDFGNQFPGAARWLEISVRTNNAVNFFTLSPRQPLTPAPYAITAGNVVGGGLAAGIYSNAVTFNNSGNSFSGTFDGNGGGLSNVNAGTLGGLATSNFWQLGGNTVAGGQFLGSTNNQPLEVHANGTRALRLEPTLNDANHSNIVNVIGGSGVNVVDSGVYGATIGGGGARRYGAISYTNEVSADFGTVAGGLGNIAGGQYATASGGTGNTAAGDSSTVSGGTANTAGGVLATVSGGVDNIASGLYATVPGGFANTASGQYSFAAGHNAKANYDGAFVWADNQNADFGSTGTNQFLIRASGGVGINKTNPNPAMALDVNGIVAATTFSGDGSQLSGVAPSSGSPSYIQNQSSVDQTATLRISGNAIFNGGSVGIGTANPVFALTVGAPDTPVTTTAQIGAFNNGNAFVVTRQTAANVEMQAGVDNLEGVVSVVSDHPLVFRAGNGAGTGNHEYMRINTNGFVGIGTSSPTNKLHVAGGVSATVFVTTSDRNAKENFENVSASEVLDKVIALPITQWTFKDMPGQKHLGPMAQDFHAAFGLGGNDTGIATVDESGVALAAIQGLNDRVDGRNAENQIRIRNLEEENARLKQRLDALERIIRHCASN